MRGQALFERSLLKPPTPAVTEKPEPSLLKYHTVPAAIFSYCLALFNHK